MNIEEKAIEVLKHCKDRNFSAFDKIYFDDETNMCIYQAIETLLTAYEEKCKELKKEIQDDLDVRNRWGLTLQELEKEKEKNKLLEDNYSSAHEDINWFCENYISKDKIKAKIEIRKEEKENCKDSIEEKYLLREIYVLQSLLEKE